MVAYPLTCIILYTGFPSGSVSCIGFALSSGKASWVQLLASYAPSLLSLLWLQVAQPSVPLLGVQFARTASMQRRAFSVVGPTAWDDLPSFLRLSPRIHSSSFYTLLKTFLYDQAWIGSASE